VLGLPHFAPLLRHAQPVCVYCGNSDAAVLTPFLRALLLPPIFPPLSGITDRLQICDWTDDGATAVAHVGSTRVHRLPARHPGEAAVLRIDDAHGPAIAYAPDNELGYAHDDPDTRAWRTTLAASLCGVAVLIHDATYTDDELARHVGWGHSSAEEATQFALEAGVATLVLFHHHPDRRDEQVDALLATCRNLAGDRLHIVAAYEGMELMVFAMASQAPTRGPDQARPSLHHPASR
jgi:hypothetical protein